MLNTQDLVSCIIPLETWRGIKGPKTRPPITEVTMLALKPKMATVKKWVYTSSEQMRLFHLLHKQTSLPK